MGLIADTLDGARAIIFDCDGTLVDSAPLYAKAWAAGLATSGHAMAEAWYRERNGLSEHAFMDSFEAETGAVLDRGHVVEIVRATFLAALDDLREVEIISDLVRSARHIMPIAVASGGPAAIVLPSLARTGLAELFAAIVTIDDGGRAKPAPDLFLTASTRLGVPPEACLVIEDSQTGIDAARAAGMAVIDVHDGGAVADLAKRLHLLFLWGQALA